MTDAAKLGLLACTGDGLWGGDAILWECRVTVKDTNKCGNDVNVLGPADGEIKKMGLYDELNQFLFYVISCGVCRGTLADGRPTTLIAINPSQTVSAP